MSTTGRVLEEHPFFEGLSPRHLEVILGCATPVQFEAGEFIAREGEAADKFYLIRRGRVALEIPTSDRGVIRFETLEPGEVLGWSWVVPPATWSFDACALELTRAIVVDGSCLHAKCAEDHDLGYEVLLRFSQILALRLEAARLQTLDVYGVRV